MLQFNVGFCRIGSNVAHLSACACLSHPRRRQGHAQAGKVRRYIQLFVASELVSDGEWFPLTRIRVARTNNKPIRLRRISALLALASCGVSRGGPL